MRQVISKLTSRLSLLLLTLLLLPAGRVAADVYVKLPYEMVNGKMIINANVDGLQGRFVFDTGAPFYITQAWADSLKHGSNGSQGIIDAAGNEFSVSKTTVNALVLGDSSTVAFRNIKANVIPKGNIVERLGVNGIVGSDIFTDYILRIDSRQHCIIITDDLSRLHVNLRAKMAMETNGQNIPFVTVNLGGGIIETAMFDSGDDCLVSPGIDVASEMGQGNPAVSILSYGRGSNGVGMGGASSVTERVRLLLKDFRMGTAKFRNLATVSIGGSGTRLGTRLLDYGIVTIDFQHPAFYYEAYSPQPVDLYKPAWNLDITYGDGYPVVAGVWADTKAGFDAMPAIGDRITAVNGVALKPVSLAEALKGNLLHIKEEQATLTLTNAAGKTYSFLIKRK